MFRCGVDTFASTTFRNRECAETYQGNFVAFSKSVRNVRNNSIESFFSLDFAYAGFSGDSIDQISFVHSKKIKKRLI